MRKHYEPVRLGDVRPSQVMWSTGPGSLIDLPHLAVIGLGLDSWDRSRARSIRESRLLQAVRGQLGYQVDQLLAPPIADDGGPGRPASNRVADGIPVAPFPRWLRCPLCGTLSEYDSGLFKLVPDPYRPDRTRFVHENCQKAKKRPPTAVPARFLAACRNGHLDDFPWRWFVHRGATKCRGALRFYEQGASLQTENLWVECVDCGVSRSMAEAFGESGKEAMPACRGGHPHLQIFEEGCDAELCPVLLGASNSWFPVTMSALAIPTGDTTLAELVKESWHMLSMIEEEEQLGLGLGMVKESGRAPRLFDHSSRDIWKAIKRFRSQLAEEQLEAEVVNLKDLEWEVLTSENPPTNWPDFSARYAEVPFNYVGVFQSVLLVERLREVNALVGFTRVEPPEEGIAGAEPPPRAPLSQYPPTWVPATEVRGEGIFIQFTPDRVRAWLELKQVRERIALLFEGHRRWRAARRLEPIDAKFPCAVHILVHSFAHILLRELALECGYNEASIRERIYASGVEDEEVHAGLLLYTAAADSDGTLGGLVELGKPENLGQLVSQGLARAQVCASDPLCSEHSAANDGTLHGAACHACSFVSETSCEWGNRYLDRALVIRTLQAVATAFFGEQVS